MSSSRRASSPTGYSRTGCRCACRSSCTNTCGAMCRGSSVEASAAVVLLSGGLDSATVLAIARQQGFICHALSVDYGQRHAAELDAARRVARAGGAREHRVMRVDFAGIGGSALTDSRLAVPETPTSGIPITYVPARNTIMLSLALARGRGARDVFIGVNVLDSSGYPDCRPEFIAAFGVLAALATRAASTPKAAMN